MSKYSGGGAPYYEPENKLLYIKTLGKVVRTVRTGSFLNKKTSSYVDSGSLGTNIAVYNILEDKTSYIFEPDSDRQIMLFLFEEEYDNETNTIVFNGFQQPVINNYKVSQRIVKDRLLILTIDADKREITFWSANKKGNNLQVIKIVPNEITWKLDVLNEKLIFIHLLDNEVKVESLDW